MTSSRVVAVVAAYNEEGRIGSAVKSLLALDKVDEVVVVADGSTDRTAEEATASGARVLMSASRRGKGGALDAALDRVDADIYLLVDGDVAETAGHSEPLIDAVADGGLELAIGRLPLQAGGGFGLVKRLSAWLVRRASGFEAGEPLSGQRAANRGALLACRPLANGFGLVPVIVNHRGKPVPATEGIALVAGLVAAAGIASLVAVAGGDAIGRGARQVGWILAGVGVVFLAGLYDDLRPHRTRGIVRQIRAAFRGRVTSGLVKLVVIVLASAVVAWTLGARGTRLVLGGEGIVLLFFDLRERSMLGDSGANALGFIVGAGVVSTLSVPGLAAALGAIVVLHVVSETATLSRVIRAAPPIRWLDELGRIGPVSGEQPEQSSA